MRRPSNNPGIPVGRPNPDKDPVSAYAWDALRERVVTCRLVKLAARRHFNDMAEGAKRGIYWHPEVAVHRIAFFRFLRHSKGEWGYAGGQVFELSPWQQFVIGSVYGWLRKDGTRRFRTAYQELARKNGKALDVDTPVATPLGWKRHGDLRCGDEVFDPAGRRIVIRGVTDQYDGPCHRVSFSDGSEIVAHELHEWQTRRTGFTGRPRGSRKSLPFVETREIAESLRHGSRGDLVHGIWTAAPLELPEAALPIHPYVLGIWLGDGHSLSPRVTTADPEVVEALSLLGPLRFISNGTTGRATTYTMTGNGGISNGDLRRLGVLGDKHIPTLYLRASVEQRRQLLAGIVDSDGHITARGQCEVVFVNRRLMDSVIELARSLGYKPTLMTDVARLNGREIGPRYRMQFWPALGEIPLRITRKLDRLRRVPAGRSRTRMIVGCDPVGTRRVNCIQVDGGMYLAGLAMVPTHNTTLMAGVGVSSLVADREPGAEIYTAATRKDQARLIFDEAKRMVRASPLLSARIAMFKNNMSIDLTASKFEPLSSDDRTLDGLNPHVILIDELHKHRTRAVLDVLDTAMGSRRQPLLWVITTAGDDSPESIYAQENDYATRVLEGAIDPDDCDSHFAFITTLDPGDRWDDPKVWVKANPNLGISVKLDDLDRQAKKAKLSPGALVEFKRLRLNMRTASSDRFIDMDVWSKNSMRPKDMPATVYRAELLKRLEGRQFFGGLDLSSKTDLSAWVKLYPPKLDGERWTIIGRYWMPLDKVEEKTDRDQVQYRRWIEEGWMEATPGNTVDHREIERAVLDDSRRGQPISIAYDPWNALQLAINLDAEGLPIVEFVQGLKSYTAPTKEFEAKLLQAELDHGDDPALRWMAYNLAVQLDKNENMMPTKRMSRGRIDGCTATIMALGRWMHDDLIPYGDGRGLQVI